MFTTIEKDLTHVILVYSVCYRGVLYVYDLR
jgi:hypothetical protein